VRNLCPVQAASGLIKGLRLAAWRSDLRPFLASDGHTNTKVQWTAHPGVAHPRVVEPCRVKITQEHSLVVNALPGLVWTAFPDGRVDFLANASANTHGLALPKPAAVGTA
jgi:hypothetical protein